MTRLPSWMPAALAALTLLTGACAQAEPLKKGALFTQSRAQLLKEGWRPVNVHAGEDYEYIGTESVLIKAKIREVDSCAMDRALCIFHYQKAKRCLRVMTSGEELATMTIESWDPTCPETSEAKDK